MSALPPLWPVSSPPQHAAAAGGAAGVRARDRDGPVERCGVSVRRGGAVVRTPCTGNFYFNRALVLFDMEEYEQASDVWGNLM